MGNVNIHRNHRGQSLDRYAASSASFHVSATKRSKHENVSISSPELEPLSRRGRLKRLVKSLKRSNGSPSSVTSPDNGMDVSTALSTITTSTNHTNTTATNTTSTTATNTTSYSAHDSIGIEANELMMLLKDEIGWNLFYEFCTKEYSVENCQCLQDIQTLQNKITRMNGKKEKRIMQSSSKKVFFR